MKVQTVLTTDWNSIKNLDDFNRQWQSFSADVGISGLDGIFSRPSCGNEISDLDDINGLIGYYDLSGKYVSQLKAAYSLGYNDLFTVSQLSATVNSKQYFSSRKLTYAELSHQLFNDIFGKMKLGSMAYKNKDEFAISSHGHDGMYSRIVSVYIPEKTGWMDVCSCWLSTDSLTTDEYYDVNSNPKNLTTDVSTFVWKAPLIRSELPMKPMIGTVRFIGAPTIQKLIDANGLTVTNKDGYIQVNPYDSSGNIRDSYDGWVFATGKEIENKNSQLSDAALIYSTGESANFVVPSFDQFFRANPSCVTVPLTLQDAQIGLKTHLHDTLEHSFSGSLTIDTSNTGLSATSGHSGEYRVHKGNPDKSGASLNIVETTASIDFTGSNITGLKTTECAQKSTKAGENSPYPKHQLIPVMVYIGGETIAYYESLA